MATPRQKKLAKVIVENATLDKPLNGGAMLEKVGYSKTMAKAKTKDVLESVGVQEELRAMGFTEENAKTVVQDIMLDVEKDANARLKAADMVFKVHGSYAPDKTDITTQGEKITMGEDKIMELAQKTADALRDYDTKDTHSDTISSV